MGFTAKGCPSICGEVHVVLVVLPVAAALPELAAQDLRRAHFLVAGLDVLAAPVVDDGVPDAHAPGVEEGEAGALLVEAEEVEVAADAAVVALARQLEGREMRRQRLLAGEGGAVDAREHLVLLVAAPVGAGQAGELEGALADAAGGGQVRAAAEIGEPALRVDADRGDLVALGLGGRDQILDELDLVGLVEAERQAGGARAGLAGPEHRERLVDGELMARHGEVLAHDARHLLLEALQVGVGDGLGELEVVVEAVLDGRADGVLGARPETQNSLSHDMRRGVAQHVEGGGLVAGKREDGDLVALVQRVRDIDEPAVDAGRDGGLGQSRPDRGGRVGRDGAVGQLKRRSIRKGDAEGHERPVLSRCAPAHLAGAGDA